MIFLMMGGIGLPGGAVVIEKIETEKPPMGG
jgi:hypothetical protein